MNQDAKQQLDTRARELFQRSCNELPQAQRMALRRVRQQALAPRRPAPARSWLPVGAMAASALALVVGWNIAPRSQAPEQNISKVHQVTTPAAPDDEFYENLDFYIWLANQRQTKALPANG